MEFNQTASRNESPESHKVENKYVFQTYDKIASDFHRTRYKPWPKVRDFVSSLEKGSVLLDIGCGNGKYFESDHCQNIIFLGCDTSIELLEISVKEKNFQVVACNVLSLPFRHKSVDNCICIAVLHHLATPKRRLDALQKIANILRPEGSCLVYVWAMEQERDGKKSLYVKSSLTKNEEVRYHESLPIHISRTAFKQQDVLVPWRCKNDNKEYLRYYHVFREGELEELVSEIKNVRLTERYFDQGNWCVKFIKQV